MKSDSWCINIYTFRLKKTHKLFFLLQAVAKDCVELFTNKNLSVKCCPILSLTRTMVQTIRACEIKN